MFDSPLDTEQVFGHSRRMASGRIRRRRAAAALIGALVVLGLPAASRAVGDRPARTATYVVRPGDTLWSIARGIQDGDPRPLVDAIQAANRADPGALVPGEVLLIPAAG
jgi:nucleoid-associated protein YgaU